MPDPPRSHPLTQRPLVGAPFPLSRGLVVILVFLVAACGGADPRPANAETAQNAAKAQSATNAKSAKKAKKARNVLTIRGWTSVPVKPRAPLKGIVAVTLRIDGAVAGSDTTRPYSVAVDGASLRPGRHFSSVSVTRRDGSRVTEPRQPVDVRPSADTEIRASPRTGFARAVRALAHGHVTVRLAPGRYPITELRLGNGARLTGAGPATVLEAPAHAYRAVVVVEGDNTLIQRLAIDGAGPGGGDGHAVLVQSGVRHFVARRLVIERTRSVGVYAWGPLEDVSIQDSVISSRGDGAAGVIGALPEGNDLSVIRSHISGFRDWGINFRQVEHDNRKTGLRSLALDNLVTDIDRPGDTQGTTEGGIWSGGADAALIGNVVRRAGWDGIETVGSSAGVSIVGNRVSGTPVAIYLEHSTTGSLIARNEISRVDTGIKVEWEHSGFGSENNSFVANEVTNASSAGLFIDVGADGNRVIANHLEAGLAGIVLQGSSRNRVAGNVVCTDGETVEVRDGRWDDNRLATPTGNLLTNNRAGSCN